VPDLHHNFRVGVEFKAGGCKQLKSFPGVEWMFANSLILLPVAGFVLAAATGVLIRARRERDDKRARDDFKINR
jgi:hypothetical protein